MWVVSLLVQQRLYYQKKRKMMKKVSCKMFFTVLWKGVCQAVKWFFGLFGYKRDGKFAKCVWGVFAVSATIVMAIAACIALYGAYEFTSRMYHDSCYSDSYSGQYVSRYIYYCEDYDGNDGFLYDKRTGKKVLKNIDWIARPYGKDSLVCFSDGKLRGYFNARNGKVVIEPRYEHAWVFSDGLAAVEEDGKVKFIDSTGKVVLDKGMDYDECSYNYVFHGGYLVVASADNEKCGLMDKTGAMALPAEYDGITVSNDNEYWRVCKGDESAVYDKNMNVVLPFVKGFIYFSDKYINVTMADHTIRKYDLSGNLINDFYINSVRHLQYNLDEVYYTKDSFIDDEGEEVECLAQKDKTATARLRAYVAGEGYEGLMTPEGRIITMPLYQSIEAIGPDTYLCAVSNDDKVIVNGKDVRPVR